MDCATYPLAENYRYSYEYYTAEEAAEINAQHVNDESWVNINANDVKSYKWSLKDGPIEMQETLNNDLERSMVWSWAGDNIEVENNPMSYVANHTKLPLTVVSNNEISKRYNSKSDDRFVITKAQTIVASGGTPEPIFLPCHIVSENYKNSHNIHPVIYFMCQASGYKLTSNKELPSSLQRFSELLPETSVKANGDDGPNNNQQSFKEQTKEFLSNLEEILIRQNQNFLLLYGDNSKKCYPPRKSSS